MTVMTIVTNTCLSLLFLQLSLRSVVSQEVLLHPYSRLVPVGTDVYFICKLRNVQYPYWMVNNIEVNANFQKNYLSARGIYILDNELDNGITTLTLRVNSSYSTINNTRVACRADGIRSTTAKLLTIDHSPLSQNPSLRQKNSTALLLQWSSPYIWPGYSVGLYNISIRNHGNDHVIYHQISAEFDDKIIDFTFVQEEQETNCSEFTFGVSAVSTDSQELSTAYVTGGFASDLHGVNLSAVALFRADGIPALVQVQLELPQLICVFQELNYSVFIEDGDGNVLSQLGPIYHHGPGNLHHSIIVSSLTKGQEYVARIKADSVIGNFTSRYFFSTKLEATSLCSMVTSPTVPLVKESDILVYKMALGICSFLLIVTLTALFICTCICCIRKGQEKSSNRSINQICDTLVTNPIYDGPVYESVLPHFDALIANTQQTNVEKSETELSDHTSSAPSTPDITQSNSVRYVDHPIQLSHLCIDKNESDCDDCSPPAATGNEQRSHLRSIVTDNQMGMFTSNSEKQVTTPSTAEESYTFMNPAGTLTLSLSAGWEEQQLN